MTVSPTQRSLKHLRNLGFAAEVVEKWIRVNGMMKGTCEQCGNSFEKAARGKPYRFCSRHCGVRGRGGPTKRSEDSKECQECGKSFRAKPFELAGRIYCSIPCYRRNAIKGNSMVNQRRGHDKERQCCQALKEMGFNAVRSAASRGPFDCWGFSQDLIVMIQVKRTKNSSSRRFPAVVESMKDIGPPVSTLIRKQLWCWVERKGWFVVDILPDGSTQEGWGFEWCGLVSA